MLLKKNGDINDKMHSYIDQRHVDRESHIIGIHDKWKCEYHNFPQDRFSRLISFHTILYPKNCKYDITNISPKNLTF